jgi:xylitol oxidase
VPASGSRGCSTTAEEHNWAGNYRYRAARIHHPGSLGELQAIVASAPRLRVLGTRHAFSDIADSAELVSLAGLPSDIAVDHDAGTVSFNAAVTYGELAGALDAEGVALANLASLPHISVAGAIVTATHGSGDANGNLATSVAGVELVTADGNVVTAARGDAEFDGLVVSLGALGALSRLTLDVVPAYRVRQRTFEALPWDTLFEHFDAITSSGYSVSLFTRWGADVEQVWVKSRVTDEPERVREELYGAPAATVDRHPILGLDTVNVTPQLGLPGLWSDRLPHFRMGFTPSSGDEIQSEYFVAREHAVAAIEALRRIGDRVRALLLVSEIRTVASDRLWLSPQYEQDTIALHFTWRREPEAVLDALREVESALSPFAARPHWGKVFLMDAAEIATRYPRLPDFLELIERHDPRGAFRNAWLDTHVG